MNAKNSRKGEKKYMFVLGKERLEIERVLESINGDIFVIFKDRTGLKEEHVEAGEKFAWVQLYAMPDMAELGYININEVINSYGSHRIWEVPKPNWVALNTYSRISNQKWRIEEVEIKKEVERPNARDVTDDEDMSLTGEHQEIIDYDMDM